MYSSAQNCKIYVGNLPDYIRPRDIEDVFFKFGRIRNVDLHDRSRGPPFAFVEFDDERGAEDAVHYRNGYDFEGYRLRVEAPRTPKYLTRPSRDRDPYDRLGDPWGYHPRSSRPPPPPHRRRRSSSKRGEFRVIVSDLPRSASWQDLKDHFREAGEIAYTDVSSDGTGVLEFSSRKAMDYAVKHFDDKKFRSHQGDSSYIRVRVGRKSKKSPTRSRSRSRSRSHSKSRTPHRSKRSHSRDLDDNRSRDKSESKKRNRSSMSDSRRGRDSRDNSVDSRDQDDSPRNKKPRKDFNRRRSDSMSSADDSKLHRKGRNERLKEESKGSAEDSSRENSAERSQSKSSDHSMKGSASPVPNSQFVADRSDDRTPSVSPEVSPERQANSKSGSRASSPQESSDSRKSSPSSSRSGSPMGNSNSSSPEQNPQKKEPFHSLTEGPNENGAGEVEVAKGEKEDSISDGTQSLES